MKYAILPSSAQLHFLAFVNPSKVPLQVVHGPRLDVWTTSSETEDWFGSILINVDPDDEHAEWWHTARPESPLGVLAAVTYSSDEQTLNNRPRITEVLFTAARSEETSLCPPTPPQSSQGTHTMTTVSESTIKLQAYLVSSELMKIAVEDYLPPLPPTPIDGSTISGTFLPTPFTPPPETVKPTTTLKRKSLAETFDQADTLRKRVRLTPGESVQAASAAVPSMPSLKELKTHALETRTASSTRPVSASSMTHVPLQTRPLSRSPSISSIGGTSGRPVSAARGATGASGEMKRSGLARVQSVALSSDLAGPSDPEIETKNRDIISRLVMAGMRLYGLSQSKSRKSQQRRASVAPGVASELVKTKSQSRHSSPAPEESGGVDEETKRKDEEYKLIYHTAYKGAVFAFRAQISTMPLQAHTETMREVVDKLLTLYCNDPLAQGFPGTGAKRVTPGGRKVFATPRDAEDDSPFALPGANDTEKDDAITPSLRKRGKEELIDQELEVKVPIAH